MSYGAKMTYAVSAYDVTPFGPDDPKPDISFDQESDLSSVLSQNTTPGFATVDNLNKKVTFTRTTGGGTPFGTVLFNATRAIGGQTNYCQSGACQFNDGIRAFFVMTFSGGGDGFTFSLLNASNNNTTSVGGDFQLGELLGYAGDGRTGTNPATYITNTLHGLQAPKMAVEFDGYYNNTSLVYCADANNLNSGRFDPAFSGTVSGGKDTVQYVFWGSRTLSVPCRGANGALYDDNRHDAKADSAGGQWTYPARALESANTSLERVKIGPSPDGTVYAIFGNNGSSSDSRLVALDPSSGALKWQIPTPIPTSGDDDLDALAVDSAGNTYIGSDQHFIFAMKPDGSQLWSPVTTSTNVESPMAVDESRNRIYFASGVGLYALDKRTGGATAGWTNYIKAESGDIASGVTVDPVDGRLYFGTNTSPFLYAVANNGGWIWKYPASTALSGDIRTRPAVNPATRDVIFGSDNGSVYAVDSLGNCLWRYSTTGAVEASPIVTTDATPRVYVGNLAGVFYCLNASNGAVIWQYPSSGTRSGRSGPRRRWTPTARFISAATTARCMR